jgi:hypothetical protein
MHSSMAAIAALKELPAQYTYLTCKRCRLPRRHSGFGLYFSQASQRSPWGRSSHHSPSPGDLQCRRELVPSADRARTARTAWLPLRIIANFDQSFFLKKYPQAAPTAMPIAIPVAALSSMAAPIATPIAMPTTMATVISILHRQVSGRPLPAHRCPALKGWPTFLNVSKAPRRF